MQNTKKDLLQPLVHILSILPIVVLVIAYSSGNLTANPVESFIQITGRVALALLVLSLLCTPGYKYLKIGRLIRLRRPLGVYAFLYAAVHTLGTVGLDYGFDMALFQEDTAGKPHIMLGFLALWLLIPLAITSTKGWMRRLGKNWERLHWLAYPAVILIGLHSLISTITAAKKDITQPIIVLALIIFILALRISWVQQFTTSLFKRR